MTNAKMSGRVTENIEEINFYLVSCNGSGLNAVPFLSLAIITCLVFLSREGKNKRELLVSPALFAVKGFFLITFLMLEMSYLRCQKAKKKRCK
jgi:hypothetical protein